MPVSLTALPEGGLMLASAQGQSILFGASA